MSVPAILPSAPESSGEETAEAPALTPAEREEVIRALRNGPRGALIVAGVAALLLFLGWLAFYFLLFMRRGNIG